MSAPPKSKEKRETSAGMQLEPCGSSISSSPKMPENITIIMDGGPRYYYIII